MGLWKSIKKYLPFLGIALFIYLLIKINIIEIAKQIRNANYLYLLIAIIFVLLYILFQTLKWYIIARKQEINVPFKKAIKINIITDFYGFVTPGRLGSVTRAGYLKEYSKGIEKGISNFIIDKVLDLSSLFIMAIVLGFVFKEKLGFDSLKFLYYLAFIFLFMLLLFFIFYKKNVSRFLLSKIYKKFIPNNLKDKIKINFDSFYENMPNIMFLLFALIVNLITWIINYSAAYFIGLSLGIEISFIYFLAIYPIATLIAQIPITISGLGTREITLIGLFGLFNVEAVKVFSMSIVSIFIMSIIPAIIAVYIILRERK